MGYDPIVIKLLLSWFELEGAGRSSRHAVARWARYSGRQGGPDTYIKCILNSILSADYRRARAFLQARS